MFLDDEFERLFKRMSNSFIDIDAIIGELKENKAASAGPFYYGYTMTVGPDGKPVVKEYGNVKPGLAPTSDTREPLVDVIASEKEKQVKLVAEMPGVEKTDVKIAVQNRLVDIAAARGEKKYHVKVPIKHKIDEKTAKASYKNGILELVFKLLDDPKPQGRKVEVE